MTATPKYSNADLGRHWVPLRPTRWPLTHKLVEILICECVIKVIIKPSSLTHNPSSSSGQCREIFDVMGGASVSMQVKAEGKVC